MRLDAFRQRLGFCGVKRRCQIPVQQSCALYRQNQSKVQSPMSKVCGSKFRLWTLDVCLRTNNSAAQNPPERFLQSCALLLTPNSGNGWHARTDFSRFNESGCFGLRLRLAGLKTALTPLLLQQTATAVGRFSESAARRPVLRHLRGDNSIRFRPERLQSASPRRDDPV